MTENHQNKTIVYCEYCGSVNMLSDRTCQSCGAPLKRQDIDYLSMLEDFSDRYGVSGYYNRLNVLFGSTDYYNPTTG